MCDSQLNYRFYCLISHTQVQPTSKPTSVRMTTTQQVLKNINQDMLETSYNTLYRTCRLHTSNEFLLACKDTNSLDVIFDFSNPNPCRCPSSSGHQNITTVGGIHMGELFQGNLRPKTLPVMFKSSKAKYAYPHGDRNDLKLPWER